MIELRKTYEIKEQLITDSEMEFAEYGQPELQ